MSCRNTKFFMNNVFRLSSRHVAVVASMYFGCLCVSVCRCTEFMARTNFIVGIYHILCLCLCLCCNKVHVCYNCSIICTSHIHIQLYMVWSILCESATIVSPPTPSLDILMQTSTDKNACVYLYVYGSLVVYHIHFFVSFFNFLCRLAVVALCFELVWKYVYLINLVAYLRDTTIYLCS